MRNLLNRWSWATVNDLALALVMAAAAVLTAWASYEGSQWDGVAADERATSSLKRADAGRSAADAVTQSVVDASVWLEWQKSVNLGRDDLALWLRERFSPALDVAQDAWFGAQALDDEGQPINGTLPKGTPLALDVYLPPGQVKAEDFSAAAEQDLADAARAGGIGSAYTLQAVIMALVLFFASVALKFTHPVAQATLTSVAVALMAFSLIRLLSLPLL